MANWHNISPRAKRGLERLMTGTLPLPRPGSRAAEWLGLSEAAPPPAPRWVIVDLTRVTPGTTRLGKPYLRLDTAGSLGPLQCFKQDLFERATAGVGRKCGLLVEEEGRRGDGRPFRHVIDIEVRGVPRPGGKA